MLVGTVVAMGVGRVLEFHQTHTYPPIQPQI